MKLRFNPFEEIPLDLVRSEQEILDWVYDGGARLGEDEIPFAGSDGLLIGDIEFTFDEATGTLRSPNVDADVHYHNTGYISTGTEITGSTFWDAGNRTLSTVLENGTVGQHFKEALIDGQNDTGGTITNGTPVEYAGSIGNSGNFRITPAIVAGGKPAFYFVGIATHDIIDGQPGNITVRGKVRGIQTNGGQYGETWAAGDIIYVSDATAGYLTNIMPEAPSPAIVVALVISAHGSNGTLEVRPSFPESLDNLSDVNGGPVVDKDVLVWNATAGYWDRTTPLELITTWTRTGTTLNPTSSTDQVEWDEFKYQDATTGGSECTFAGVGTGRLNTGDYNTAFGYQNLYSNVTGVQNTAMGRQALYSNVSGSNNMASGRGALRANLASNNYASGTLALYSNIVGINNIAIGTSALQANLASGNVAAGKDALKSNTTGTLNFAFGEGTLKLNVDGSNNVGMGSQVLAKNISGSGNIGVGTFALFNSTSANNTAVGVNALPGCITGQCNTAIGRSAGRDVLGTGGLYLGCEAGVGETGSYKLYIESLGFDLVYGEFNNRLWEFRTNVKMKSDTYLLYFGAGDDMSMVYDGSTARINTSLVAPSDLVISCGTEKTLELTQGVWDDINIGGVALAQGASNRPALVTFDTTNMLVYSFSSSQTNALHGNVEIIHTYKEGTDLKPHLHWYPTNADTGDARWGLEYTIENTTGTIVSGTIYVNSTASGTAWQGQIASFPDITGTGIGIGAQFHFRLFRDGTDAADDYNTSACIATFGLHHQVNTHGSRQVATK